MSEWLQTFLWSCHIAWVTAHQHGVIVGGTLFFEFVVPAGDRRDEDGGPDVDHRPLRLAFRQIVWLSAVAAGLRAVRHVPAVAGYLREGRHWSAAFPWAMAHMVIGGASWWSSRRHRRRPRCRSGPRVAEGELRDHAGGDVPRQRSRHVRMFARDSPGSRSNPSTARRREAAVVVHEPESTMTRPGAGTRRPGEPGGDPPASRPRGPGGQNVNKVNTRMELWLDLAQSPACAIPRSPACRTGRQAP